MKHPFARDIDFWCKQTREHMALLVLGLADGPYRRTAGRLELGWSGISSSSAHASDILGLLLDTHELESDLARQTQRMWLGWLAPDFYHHIVDEAVYFKKLLTTPVSPRDEYKTWIDILADHVISLGSMVDPSKQSMIVDSFALSGEIRQLEKWPLTMTTVSAAKLAAEEADSFLLKTAKVPSTIPEALRAHALREDAWFRRVLAERIQPAASR